MQSISEILLSQVTDILSVKFSSLLKSVHDELVNKYDISEEDMNDIWSRVAPDIKLNIKESKPNVIINKKENSNCDNDCCIFIFKKGGRKGEQCDRKKAKKSNLGYCSIHIKEETEDTGNTSNINEKKPDYIETCCFKFKKGTKKGHCCTNKVSKSSKMGYCVVHKKEESNNVKDKKESEEESDDEDSKSIIINKTLNIKDVVKKVSSTFNKDSEILNKVKNNSDWSDCESDNSSSEESDSSDDDDCFRKA
jgi:hypothetical protein